MTPVSTTVRTHLQANDALQETIEWTEIVARFDTDTPLSATPRRSSRYGVWVAVAVAVVTVLIIGIIPILLNGEETQPADTGPVTTVDESPVTTIVGEAAPEPAESLPLVAETPWAIEDIPSDAESGSFDTPLGLVSWVSLPIDEDTRPLARCYGGDAGGGGCQVAEVMPWPSGFAIFQPSVAGFPPPAMPEVPARFWVSTDGLNWREESLPSDPWARGVSLTLDNGVYWSMSEEPAGLWYTTYGSTWHEIDPTGLAPPGSSVGPAWIKNYDSPITAGDLTLSYGAFYEGDYPDGY